MTPQIALTLAIIVAAVILFATEKLRVNVVALLVLLTLALTGLVTLKPAASDDAHIRRSGYPRDPLDRVGRPWHAR